MTCEGTSEIRDRKLHKLLGIDYEAKWLASYFTQDMRYKKGAQNEDEYAMLCYQLLHSIYLRMMRI